MSKAVTFEERVKESTRAIRDWASTPLLIASDDFEGLISMIMEYERIHILEKLSEVNFSQYAEVEVMKAICSDGAMDVYLDDIQRGIKVVIKELIKKVGVKDE